jgi:hypothetical protein
MANVTREENLLSRKLEKGSPEQEEDLKTKTSATNAKRKVTGLTSAETKEEAEERILPQDPDPIDPQIQEESPRIREETEEDHLLHQADLHQGTPDQKERITEEESHPPTQVSQVQTAEKDLEVDVTPSQSETPRDKEVSLKTPESQKIQARSRSPMLQETQNPMTKEERSTGQEVDQ